MNEEQRIRELEHKVSALTNAILWLLEDLENGTHYNSATTDAHVHSVLSSPSAIRAALRER